MTARRWEVVLPWTSPPMSMNDRDHWRVHRRKVAMVRNIAHALMLQHKIPKLERCAVQLMYAPRDRRRRDTDNLAHVLKALCDGIVSAGVVRDDTPDLMLKPEPRIVEPVKGGLMWLVITDLSDWDVQEHYAFGGELPVGFSFVRNDSSETEYPLKPGGES